MIIDPKKLIKKNINVELPNNINKILHNIPNIHDNNFIDYFPEELQQYLKML